MKKTLGSLNTRSLRASEPLRIGLTDIRATEKQGKWWLVGASWRNDPQTRSEPAIQTPASKSTTNSTSSATIDLLHLAKERRMNTDVRKAIFISIMSASDYEDAYKRLNKLNLKRAQVKQIPLVLMDCLEAENPYNPYYTLIARRLCAERKLRWAFQSEL